MSQQSWRSQLRKHAPASIREWVTSARLRKVRQHNAARSAEDVFSEIYLSGVWGAGEAFDSGTGSRGTPAEHYATYIRDLVRDGGLKSAVDIGCGDFRVAAQFADALETYHGVDVVRELVTRNSAVYGRPGVTFSVLDAARDDLPGADVCLVRQVLQHLSNNQIADILTRCRKYPLVLVTEHWPAPNAARQPNVDKAHGPDTRLDLGSWVDITRAPFDCASVTEVLRVPVEAPLYRAGETIRTHLWRPNA